MKTAKILNVTGSIFILFSIIGFFFTLGPGLKQEVNYEIRQVTQKNITKEEQLQELERSLDPVDTGFSILIPKINATTPVVKNINPFDEKEFSIALRKGVAHASGSALPGNVGNVYLFAHSTDAFYNVGRYNAVFYLLGKLNYNDEIYIYYQNSKYKYLVFDKKIVEDREVKYLEEIEPGQHTLTLQTCYPPGTTLKRLIVMARQID